jgi:hypothetical protein
MHNAFRSIHGRCLVAIQSIEACLVTAVNLREAELGQLGTCGFAMPALMDVVFGDHKRNWKSVAGS